MCSFLVYSEEDIEREVFEKECLKLEYRGPDMRRFIYNSGMWGFCRLAIMGIDESGMQPFCRDNKLLVCNGEIYGFRKLKEKYSSYQFESESDCEVVFPLYDEYGLDMFSKLDAEFACVFYDGEKLIAGRDPIGIRPMFYGYSIKSNSIMFASEAKALVDLCEEVKPFPPGYYYVDGKFICYYDAREYSKLHRGKLENITKKDVKYNSIFIEIIKIIMYNKLICSFI